MLTTWMTDDVRRQDMHAFGLNLLQLKVDNKGRGRLFGSHAVATFMIMHRCIEYDERGAFGYTVVGIPGGQNISDTNNLWNRTVYDWNIWILKHRLQVIMEFSTTWIFQWK